MENVLVFDVVFNDQLVVFPLLVDNRFKPAFGTKQEPRRFAAGLIVGNGSFLAVGADNRVVGVEKVLLVIAFEGGSLFQKTEDQLVRVTFGAIAQILNQNRIHTQIVVFDVVYFDGNRRFKVFVLDGVVVFLDVLD